VGKCGERVERFRFTSAIDYAEDVAAFLSIRLTLWTPAVPPRPGDQVVGDAPLARPVLLNDLESITMPSLLPAFVSTFKCALDDRVFLLLGGMEPRAFHLTQANPACRGRAELPKRKEQHRIW